MLKGSEKTIITLEEKIKLIKEYITEGGNPADIKTKTTFKGYPIGQWAQVIRYLANKLNRGQYKPATGYYTAQQLEEMRRLGILSRRIEATLDEKIDMLTQWYKEYPTIHVEYNNIHAEISEKIAKQLQKVATETGMDLANLEEEYRKMQRYKQYVINRNSRNKLTEEQQKRCREANLGMIFGYPTRVIEQAKKYQIEVPTAFEVCSTFGSMEEFIKKYRAGELTDEEYKYYNKNLINNLIDSDNNSNSTKYDNLVREIFKGQKNVIYIYSSSKLEDALKTLKGEYESIIRKRFGIDGSVVSDRGIAREKGVSHQAIEQQRKRALNNLKEQRRVFIILSSDNIAENIDAKGEEKQVIDAIEEKLWDSGLFFRKGESRGNIYEELNIKEIIKGIKSDIEKRAQEERFIEWKNRVFNAYLEGLQDKGQPEKGNEQGPNDELIAEFLIQRIIMEETRIKRICEEIDASISKSLQEDAKKEITDESTNGILTEEQAINDKKDGEGIEENIETRVDVLSEEDGLEISMDNMKRLDISGEKKAELVECWKKLILQKINFDKVKRRQQEMLKPKDTLIEKWNFSARTYNALKKAGINTVGDLVSKTPEELKKIKNLGTASVIEIINKMKECGIELENYDQLLNVLQRRRETLRERSEERKILAMKNNYLAAKLQEAARLIDGIYQGTNGRGRTVKEPGKE